MSKWYVKDLSKLTGVTVQTLHHYDRIGLLKPSLRQSNGYRLYSENDLLRLQQIIALKYFGFELSRIKELLAGKIAIADHFAVQAQFLAEKANTLLEASQTLKNITAEYSQNKSIPFETIIKLIEVYRMTQQLEKTWAGKVFNAEELKQYAKFESSLQTKYTPAQKENFEKSWRTQIELIQTNLQKDPKSELGQSIAKNIMDLINSLYGKENANLKQSIWEKGFKQGHMEGDKFVAPEVVAWMDKAIDNYYRERIYAILDQAENKPSPDVEQQWHALMEEMYGNSEKPKQELIDVAMTDSRVSLAARRWLQQLSK